MDLADRPATLTVRGRTRPKDGQIHTDSKTKLITVLLYLNRHWDSPGGRLRLLKNEHDLEDYIAEVPPIRGRSSLSAAGPTPGTAIIRMAANAAACSSTTSSMKPPAAGRLPPLHVGDVQVAAELGT